METGSNREPVAELCELSPFSLFCALYLGVTEDNRFRRQDRRSVAKRFGLAEEELDDYLETHGISAAAVAEAQFDVPSARFDIQVAPEGISRVELARTIFEEFRDLTSPPSR